MWKNRLGLWHVKETNLFVPVLVLGLPAAATPPGGCDIPGDDRDLMQWHVHPSRPVFALTNTETSPAEAAA